MKGDFPENDSDIVWQKVTVMTNGYYDVSLGCLISSPLLSVCLDSRSSIPLVNSVRVEKRHICTTASLMMRTPLLKQPCQIFHREENAEGPHRNLLPLRSSCSPQRALLDLW